MLFCKLCVIHHKTLFWTSALMCAANLPVCGRGFFLASKNSEKLFNHSFPTCGFFFFFFFKVEISSCTLVPLFRPGSVHSGSASWDDCGWVFSLTSCITGVCCSVFASACQKSKVRVCIVCADQRLVGCTGWSATSRLLVQQPQHWLLSEPCLLNSVW